MKLTTAQSRVMYFLNKGGIIESYFGKSNVIYQKIPYRVNIKTINKMFELGLISKAGSIGSMQVYVKTPNSL